MSTNERRKNLTYTLPTRGKNMEAHIRHDGKGYLVAIWEGDNCILEDEQIEMKNDTRLDTMEKLMHYTWGVIAWEKVTKGDGRALSQASGLRIDDIHAVMASWIDDGDQERKKAERRFGLFR